VIYNSKELIEMKTFNEWLSAKNEAGLSGFMPNMGQRAIPINQGQPAPAQQPQQKQISLSTIAPNVKDPNWIQLYEIFTRMFGRQPNDPAVQQLGQALQSSGTTGNMTALQPFVQKFLKAQSMR
jgi:hypothetical protein